MSSRHRSKSDREHQLSCRFFCYLSYPFFLFLLPSFFSVSLEEEMDRRSGLKAAAPFAAMITVECVEIGLVTLSKAAMTRGMNNFVFVVYYNAVGTLFLLPHFICHRFRGKRLPITFRLLCRFFLLGLIGICLLQICAYMGINYSSPTLAAAIGNLIPAFTFLLAIMIKLEKLDLRNSSSQAKSLGTLIAISGALVVTLYKGPPILVHKGVTPPTNSSSSSSSYKGLVSHRSNWPLGGLLLTITCVFSSIWNILQAATAKEYADPVTIVFFYSFFGTVQSAFVSLLLERNLEAWKVNQAIEIIAIIYAAFTVTVFRNTVVTWCLSEKGPVYVATYKPLGIAIAVVMGFIFLGDSLYLGSLIGATIITAGFYAVVWGQAREENGVDDTNCLDDSLIAQKAPLLQSGIHDMTNQL